jgi:hypothetical protein
MISWFDDSKNGFPFYFVYSDKNGVVKTFFSALFYRLKWSETNNISMLTEQRTILFSNDISWRMVYE